MCFRDFYRQFWALIAVPTAYMLVSTQPIFAASTGSDRDPGTETAQVCREALESQASYEPHDLLFPEGEKTLYTRTEGLQGRILRMTNQEYTKATEEESIPQDSILVLDDINLEIDLPLVAGVILSKPLPAEGTHIQDISESMEIPLIHVEGAYESSDLITAETKGGYFKLHSNRETPGLTWSHELEVIHRKRSVLPGPSKLNEETPSIVPAHDTQFYPREVVGDKFFPLSRLYHENVDHFQPRMASITDRFFEDFMRLAEFEGASLMKTIEIGQVSLEKAKSTEEEKEILENMRTSVADSFFPSENMNVIEQTFLSLVQQLNLSKDSKLILRSNNDVEDLIAAGLYKSIVIDKLTTKSFVSAVKEIYASLFTHRAYQIRRRRGLLEENLRMPLLAHEYVENVDYHATAKISMDAETGFINATVNLVLGSESVATSPSSSSQVVQFKFQSTSERSFDPVQVPDIGHHLSQPLRMYLSGLIPAFEKHLSKMAILPQSIGLEFAGKKIKESSNYYRPILLQYKHKYDSKTTAEVLNGNLLRSDLDHEFTGDDSDSIVNFAKNFGTTPLHKATLRSFSLNSTKYALIRFKGKYEIIFWNHGELHEGLKSRITFEYPGVKWISSGYLNDPEPGRLHFSANVDPSVDRALNVTDTVHRLIPKTAFRQAVQNAYRRAGTFNELLTGREFLSYDTFYRSYKVRVSRLVDH